MTDLDKMVVGMEMKAGETVICTVHPKADTKERPGRNPGSTVYSIPVVLEDGRIATLRGGSRLIVAMQEALHGCTDVTRISVTATGEAGTLARDWVIKRI